MYREGEGAERVLEVSYVPVMALGPGCSSGCLAFPYADRPMWSQRKSCTCNIDVCIVMDVMNWDVLTIPIRLDYQTTKIN